MLRASRPTVSLLTVSLLTVSPPTASLAFFLGTLGIHNFYLGYTTKGIIQLVISLTVVGLIVTGIWAFIDFIMLIMRSGSYACDAQGQPLQ